MPHYAAFLRAVSPMNAKMPELKSAMLMELKRPAEANAEYRSTLQKEPNRRRSLRHVGLNAR